MRADDGGQGYGPVAAPRPSAFCSVLRQQASGAASSGGLGSSFNLGSSFLNRCRDQGGSRFSRFGDLLAALSSARSLAFLPGSPWPAGYWWRARSLIPALSSMRATRSVGWAPTPIQ